MLVFVAAIALVAVAVAVSVTGRSRAATSSSAAGGVGQKSSSTAEVPVAPGLWVNSLRLWDQLSPLQKADLVARLDKLTSTFNARARAFRPQQSGLRVRLVPPAKPALSLGRAGPPPSLAGGPELAAVTIGDGPEADFPSASNELWSAIGSVSTDQPCVTDTGSMFRSVADVLSLCAGWGNGVTGPAGNRYTTSGLSTAVVVGGGDELASALTGLSAGHTVPTTGGATQTVNATVTVTSLQVVAGWEVLGAACAPAEVTEADPGASDGATAYGEPGGMNLTNISSCWSSLAFGAIFDPAVQAANTAYGALTAGVKLVQSAVDVPGSQPCAEVGFAASYASYIRGVNDLVKLGNGGLKLGASVSLRELGIDNSLSCNTNTYNWCSPDVPAGTQVGFGADPESDIRSEGVPFVGVPFVADMLVNWTSVDVSDTPCPGQASGNGPPPGGAISGFSGTYDDGAFTPPGTISGDSLTISVPGTSSDGSFSGVFSISQFATGTVAASGDIEGNVRAQGAAIAVTFTGQSASAPSVQLAFSGLLEPLSLGLVGTLEINGTSEPASFLTDG